VAIRPSFRRCYSAALARDPSISVTLHGTVVFRGDGTVKSVDLGKSARSDPELAACLTKAIKTLSLDADGTERTISF
jgi:hypothetical protein